MSGMIKQAMAIAMLAAGMLPVAVAASAQDEVMKTEKGIAAATNADELTPYYAPEVVLYDMVVPGEFHGWKAAHDNFAAQFAQVKNPKVEILNIEAGAQGGLGWAYSTQKFSFDVQSGHQEITFRQTDLLKKIKGKWLVVHQHLSVPYDPASGKAQLTPAAK